MTIRMAVRAVPVFAGVVSALAAFVGCAHAAGDAAASSPQVAIATPRPTTKAEAAKRPDAPPVSLHSLGHSLGLEATWLKNGEKLRLKSKWSTLEFELAKREIAFNGLRVFLGDGVEKAKRTLAVSALDRDRLLLPILAPQNLDVRTPLKVIVLDPGHGGKDTGTSNKALKLEEKNLTLDVAKRAKLLLEAKGFKVVLTRTDDTYPTLTDRAAKAATSGADLFISIHFNATGSDKVRGIETYMLTPQFQRSTGSDKERPEDAVAVAGNVHDGWNSFLGYTMHRQLQRDLALADRGLKRARFQVLREAPCPAILVEGGYLSHPEEAKLVGSASFRQQLAAAIVDGIDSYNQTLVRLADARAGRKGSAASR